MSIVCQEPLCLNSSKGSYKNVVNEVCRVSPSVAAYVKTTDQRSSLEVRSWNRFSSEASVGLSVVFQIRLPWFFFFCENSFSRCFALELSLYWSFWTSIYFLFLTFSLRRPPRLSTSLLAQNKQKIWPTPLILLMCEFFFSHHDILSRYHP